MAQGSHVYKSLCKGHVADNEADPYFYGYIVQGLRPLAFGDEGWLGYGAHGTVFPTYAAAIQAVIDTVDYAERHTMTGWFNEGKWRIFSVTKRKNDE